jgi:hypothetical protein
VVDARFHRRRVYWSTVVTVALVLTTLRADSYPSPTGTLAYLGYYNTNDKTGDDSAAVRAYTNMFITNPGLVVDSASTDHALWSKEFDRELKKAAHDNQQIYLELGCEQQCGAWDGFHDTLVAAAPYWDHIGWIEIVHEGGGKSLAEINGTRADYDSWRTSLSLGYKPLGVLYTVADLYDFNNQVCEDGNAKAVIPTLTFVNIEAYEAPANQNWSSDALEQDLRSKLESAKNCVRQASPIGGGKPMFMTAMAYDGSDHEWTNVQTLSALQPIYYDNLRADRDVIGIQLFSYHRVGASKDRPQLRPAHRNMAVAMSLLRVPGDFNRDAEVDLAVWRPSTSGTGTFYWLNSSSTPTGGAAALGSAGDVPLTGDVDGDGLADVVVYHPSTGQWSWLTSSTGYRVTSQGGATFGGGAADVPLLADVNGNGHADLIIWRPNDSGGGRFYWADSTGVNSAGPFGGTGDIPLVADIDGDGKADLALWRPSNGTFYWLSSSNGFSTSAASSLQFGGPGDVPFLADMHADGRAGFVVWRPTTGVWYWHNWVADANDHTDFQITFDGQQGDVPLVADLDGDGQGDLSVFRDGQFISLKSTSGWTAVTTQAFGTIGDVPILR